MRYRFYEKLHVLRPQPVLSVDALLYLPGITHFKFIFFTCFPSLKIKKLVWS